MPVLGGVYAPVFLGAANVLLCCSDVLNVSGTDGLSLSDRILSSSVILILNQLVLKGLGLISVLILARLLTPEDFGIVALVSITLLFFDLLSDAGSQQYLIQKTDVQDRDYDTAWTIDFIMKFILGGVLFLFASYVALFFEEPQLLSAIQVIALVLPIKALKNPRLAQLAREYSYKKLVYLQILQKIGSFTVVILIVTVEPSYWALIAGDIAAALIFTLGSYFIVKHVPRWSLANIKQQWKFSQWLLLRGMVGFLRGQLDMAFVSKLFGTTTLGGYHMTRELALIPAHNLLIPALEPLLVAISQSKHDSHELAYRVQFSLYCAFLVVIPLAVFIWFFSYEIIVVVLGDQWAEYHQLLKYFSLMFLTFPLFALLSDFLIATGKVRTLFVFDLSTTILLLMILLLSMSLAIEMFTLIRSWTSIAITIFFLYLVNRIVSFNWIRLLLHIAFVLGISMLCAGMVELVTDRFEVNSFLVLVVATILYFGPLIGGYVLTSNVLFKRWEEIGHLKRILNTARQKYLK